MKNKPELAEDCVETKTQGNSEAEVEGDEENHDRDWETKNPTSY